MAQAGIVRAKSKHHEVLARSFKKQFNGASCARENARARFQLRTAFMVRYGIALSSTVCYGMAWYGVL